MGYSSAMRTHWRIPSRTAYRLMVGLVVTLAGCSHGRPGSQVPVPAAAPHDVTAPDSFTVLVETSRGPLLLMIHRDWAPRGVDRFYTLVQQHFYDKAGVFRVVPKFVVQFGLAADPAATARYRDASLRDDSVRQSNLRGTISFARSGPNSRTTQLFINLADNGRLDRSNGFGFAPIGVVLSGMEHVDAFNAEYSAKGPQQDSISRRGNAYLKQRFPRLDYLKRARVREEWPRSPK